MYASAAINSGRHHQLLFCRMRRATSEGGFLMTIHSIIVVAADRAYLDKHRMSFIVSETYSPANGIRKIDKEQTNQVKIYWVWLLRRLTSAGLPMGIPFASRS